MNSAIFPVKKPPADASAASAQQQCLTGGVSEFLAKYCPNPQVIEAALQRVGLNGRVKNLVDQELLCRNGDAADCLWIICQGEVRVESDVLVVIRKTGQALGEQAFYRPAKDGDGFPIRGAALRAIGEVKVLRVDVSLLAAFTDAEKAVWHETMARVLSEKLDEATSQRATLRKENTGYVGMLDRFVCAEGRQAANYALGFGPVEIPIIPARVNAIFWFSDVAGFSAYAASASPADVGVVIRSIMDIKAECLHAAEGQIDKFMGDGLMAFWIAPDDLRMQKYCRAAVAAAHQAGQRVNAYYKERNLPLGVRIGLHVCEVTMGDFGGGNRIAFTSIGEAVNAAARYEQAVNCAGGKPLGCLRVSPDVFKHVNDAALMAAFRDKPIEFEDKHKVRFTAHTSNY